jgi:hypothetical protein
MFIRLRVALTVARDFRFPPRRVALGRRAMFGAPMPEATVDEDCRTGARKSQVRAAAIVGQRARIDSIAKASAMKQ